MVCTSRNLIRGNYYLNLLRVIVLWIHLQWQFQGKTEDIMNTMILGLYVCRQWKQSPRSFSQMFHESFFWIAWVHFFIINIAPSYIVMEVTISRCYHNDIVWAGSSNTEFIIDMNICFRNQIYIMKIEIIKSSCKIIYLSANIYHLWRNVYLSTRAVNVFHCHV